nr:hypothetical protein [Acetobacter persici]
MNNIQRFESSFTQREKEIYVILEDYVYSHILGYDEYKNITSSQISKSLNKFTKEELKVFFYKIYKYLDMFRYSSRPDFWRERFSLDNHSVLTRDKTYLYVGMLLESTSSKSVISFVK